ncbi:HSP70-domain-containing protein, partial [Neocallimastix californiae]
TYAIGIDLGSKYSSVGVWKNDHIEIIPNEFDKRKTFSYVSFTNSESLVGDKAFQKARMNINNTVFDIKRLIGRDYNDPDVQSDMKYWPFNIVDKENKPYIQIQYNNEKRFLSPEEVTSMVIIKLKEMAENYLNQTITDAVITVPAYFNDSQRRATIDAGRIAGLNVLKIINEPTAAAIAYNYNNKSKGDENILIIDFGEGTYDASIIHINDSNITVKATVGDTHLGGEDFNNRLVDHFIKEINDKYGIDISNNPKSLYRLRKSCEQVKCNLSSFKEATIEIDYLHDKIDTFSSKITRTSFEELCSDLFERITKSIGCVLYDSKLNKKDIHEIVLVGGSTRIPKFQNIISSYFDGKKINKTVNVDEAVTFGAVIQASIFSKKISKQIKCPTISDVFTRTLCVYLNNEHFKLKMKHNSLIPNKCKFSRFISYLYSLEIYEYAKDNFKNKHLLEKIFPHNISEEHPIFHCKFPSKKKNVSSNPYNITIDISFYIDENGITDISIQLLNTIYTYITTDKQYNKILMKNIKEYKKINEKENLRLESMDNLEKHAYYMRSLLNDKRIISNIPPEKIDNLKSKIENIIEWIKNNQNSSKEEYEKKLSGIKEI